MTIKLISLLLRHSLCTQHVRWHLLCNKITLFHPQTKHSPLLSTHCMHTLIRPRSNMELQVCVSLRFTWIGTHCKVQHCCSMCQCLLLFMISKVNSPLALWGLADIKVMITLKCPSHFNITIRERNNFARWFFLIFMQQPDICVRIVLPVPDGCAYA